MSARSTNLCDKTKKGLAKTIWNNKLNWTAGNETRERDGIKELALDRALIMTKECKERVIMALATGMGVMGMQSCRRLKLLMLYLVNQPKPLSA